MAGRDRTSPSPDRDLVIAFQNGDESAYELLYRRHIRRVVALCLRFLHNPSDAEEAAQETFLRAYESLHRFNGDYRVAAWLKRVATNVCLDRLRVRARSPVVVGLPRNREPVSAYPSPEAAVVGPESDVSQALQGLRPLHARAIHLRAVEGLSYNEIAKRLAISPSQVKSLLHRARTSLRRTRRAVKGLVLAPVWAAVRDLAHAGGARLMDGSAGTLVVEHGIAAAFLAVTAGSAMVVGGAPQVVPDVGVRKPAMTAAAPADATQERRPRTAPRTRVDVPARTSGRAPRAVSPAIPPNESIPQEDPAAPEAALGAPVTEVAGEIPVAGKAAAQVLKQTTETLEDTLPLLVERLRRGTSNE